MKEESYPGKFIVVEGPDASGKQTQTERIAEWLRESNYSRISERKEENIIEKMPGTYPGDSGDSIENGVWRLSFPTYTETAGGRVVDAYLNGRLGDRGELEITDIVDIYAADRKQFKVVIRDYLKSGGIIVCDRYREANLIHQLVDFEGSEWYNMLEKVKESDNDLPGADEIIYLDISPEEAIERMQDRERDMHELDKSYMEKSNRNGLKVAEYENWEIIDGERSKKEIESDIKRFLKAKVL